MADQDLNHTAELIKAAIPFVDSKSRGMAEIFAKLLDFLGSFKSVGKSDTLAANGLQSTKFDFEGLLKGIRPICNKKEREYVDKILNIFNMKRIFETYNNMMSTMNAMQEFGGFSFGDSEAENDADNVTGNFSGSNFESIFRNFSSNFSQEEAKAASVMQEADEANNEQLNNNTDSNAKDSGEDNPPNSNNQNPGMNNKMFDMLKAMVPPEQMSTFENLSMLLNTMSYDNSSKPDESKE